MKHLATITAAFLFLTPAYAEEPEKDETATSTQQAANGGTEDTEQADTQDWRLGGEDSGNNTNAADGNQDDGSNTPDDIVQQ